MANDHSRAQPTCLLCVLAEDCSIAGDVFGPIVFERENAERDLADAFCHGQAAEALTDVAQPEFACLLPMHRRTLLRTCA